MNTANLNTEERSQFRQLASQYNVTNSGLSPLDALGLKVVLSGLISDDGSLTVGPSVVKATPLSSPIKAIVFALFDKARNQAAALSPVSANTEIGMFAILGIIIGSGIGWLVAR